MMAPTFAELLAGGRSLEELRGLWLVIDASLKDSLLEKQRVHGDGKNFVEPIALTNGKFALCADLLTEIGPGGFFRDSFSALDRIKFAAVAVITSDELAEIAIQE